MRPIRFLLAFVLVSGLSWAMYGALFLFQIGSRTAAEYWIYDAVTVKNYLIATSAQQRKMLFVGGSSVWFGIDAQLIQQTLGVQTLNLGLHAMRPLEQLVSEVRPALKPGDTVIMPLEYEYYLIDTPYNDWYVNQVMVGEPDVFWALSWPDKLSFFLAVPPIRVLEGVATKMFPDRNHALSRRLLMQPTGQVVNSIQQDWINRALPDENFTFRNIDSYGDAIITRGSFASYTYPLSVEPVAASYPWKILADFAQYCADHSVALYIAWPPVVDNMLAFKARPIKDKVGQIEGNLVKLGLPILGHPEDFQYDRRLFADSGYHLNHEGRTLHTEHILRVLNQEFSNDGRCTVRPLSCQASDEGPAQVFLKNSANLIGNRLTESQKSANSSRLRLY